MLRWAIVALLAVSLPAQSNVRTHIGPNASGNFGRPAIAVGDINGDGFGDYAIAAPNFGTFGAQFQGRVQVFDGASGIPGLTLTGPAGSRLGWKLAGGGDVDGDGAPDLAVVSIALPGFNSGGIIELYSGATGGIINTISAPPGSSNGWFASTLLLEDVDGDGISEVIAAVPDFNEVRIMRTNGTIVTTITGSPTSTNIGTWGIAVGDLDGDGWTDFAFSYDNFSEDSAVFSGQTGAQIFSLLYPGSNVRGDLVAPGDLDGDGIPDVIIQTPFQNGVPIAQQTAYAAISGASAAVLWTTPVETQLRVGMSFPQRIIALSDLDGDGIRDWACAATGGNGENGKVVAHAGADGRMLWVSRGSSIYYGSELEPAGDVDGDGTTDLLVTTMNGNSSSGPADRVTLVSGRLGATNEATSVMLGLPCPYVPDFPFLITDDVPRIDATVNLELRRAPPNGPGLLVVDVGFPSPIPGVTGCTTWPDPTRLPNWIVMPFTADGFGDWTLAVPVPNDPILVGLPITLQAVLGTGALTNGAVAILGT